MKLILGERAFAWRFPVRGCRETQSQPSRSICAEWRANFGALSFAGLGFAVGPFVGGVLLQYFGGPWTFVITAAVTITGGCCYWRSHRLRAPALSSVYVNSPADLT